MEGKDRNKFVKRNFCVSHWRIEIKRVWNSHSNQMSVWKGFVNSLEISVHVCAHFYLGLGLMECGTENVLPCPIKGHRMFSLAQRMGKVVQTRDVQSARILSNNLLWWALLPAREIFFCMAIYFVGIESLAISKSSRYG